MVAAILDDGGDVAIVEAGTGTGKTFAYLLPALLSGARVIISTGTRHLQDQLYQHDLPVVRRALKRPVKTALLKGRSNYLCRYRLQATQGRSGGYPPASRWSSYAESVSGSSAPAAAILPKFRMCPNPPPSGRESPLPWITAWVRSVRQFDDCFLVKARRDALAADVLVINHHLLCADFGDQETGFAQLLPGAEAFILYEAHQLPDIASHFFGRSLSGRQLSELAQDTVLEQLREAGDFPDLRARAEALEPAILTLRQALGMAERRALWREVADELAVQEARLVSSAPCWIACARR